MGQDILTKRQFRLRSGDWLMSKVQILHRAYGIVPPSLDGAVASGSYYAFRPSEEIDLKFLWYFSHHPAFHESCALASVGVVIEKMVFRVEDWQAFDALLPPLPEQRKIAAILSSVDDAIAAARKVIEQTKRVKQGLLQTLMTRGIGHTRYKKTEIGVIPEAWEVVRLKDGSFGRGEYGASASKSPYSAELPRYLRITDLNENGSLNDSDLASLQESEAAGYLVEPGDVLFARSGATVGKTYRVTGAEGRAAFAGYLIRFKPDTSKLHPVFLEAYTHSEQYRHWVSDTQRAMAQPNINATEYRAMPLPLPPLKEQEQVAAAYTRLVDAQQQHNRVVEALQTLKQGLLQDLLTGLVRVHPD